MVNLAPKADKTRVPRFPLQTSLAAEKPQHLEGLVLRPAWPASVQCGM